MTTAEITSQQDDYITSNYNSSFWPQHEETMCLLVSAPPVCQLSKQPSPSQGQRCLCSSVLGNLSELVSFQDKTVFKAIVKALTLAQDTDRCAGLFLLQEEWLSVNMGRALLLPPPRSPRILSAPMSAAGGRALHQQLYWPRSLPPSG